MAKRNQQADQANSLTGIFGVGKSKEPSVEEQKPKSTKKEIICLDVTGRKDYLKRMAGARGISVTAFVQMIIDEHAEAHGKQYEALCKLTKD